MDISPELFSTMVSSLTAGDGRAAATDAAAEEVPPAAGTRSQAIEQRRRPRVGVRTEARATLIPLTLSGAAGGAPLTVTVRDLSTGGIGFLHSEKISLDEQFVLILPLPEGASVALLCA